jgi:Cu(I)/Ag(I) efflux system membrane fusion protein
MHKRSSSKRVRLTALAAVLILGTGCGQERPRATGGRIEDPATTSGHLPVPERLDLLRSSPNRVIVSSVATVRPQWLSRARDIEASGVVTYDTRRLYTIAARFGGRIERLYVRSRLESIRKGQRLLEMYSPEIVTAQRELLYLLDADATNVSLIAGAEQKLRFLGVTDAQIAALRRTRTVSYSLAVFSPYNGYVLDGNGDGTSMSDVPVPATNMVTPSTSDAMGGGMDGGVATQADPSSAMPSAAARRMVATRNNESIPLLLREGQYVRPGEPLFRVVDASRLWIELSISTHDARGIQSGARVTLIEDEGGVSREATVDFVAPLYDANHEHASVRVTVSGSPAMRVGQIIRGVIHQPARAALWLPASAVLDLGDRQVVFRKDANERNAFRPVTVAIGERAGDMIAIHRGVSPEDEVAKDAQFLVDSESFITADAGTQQ